jgi:hypothetical protein
LFQADQKPAVEHATFHVATRRTGQKNRREQFLFIKTFQVVRNPLLDPGSTSRTVGRWRAAH